MERKVSCQQRENYSYCVENFWDRLYSTLQRQVSTYVYSTHVPIWCGQEQDVINDILQETLLRIWLRQQDDRAEPIHNLEAFAAKVARNCCHDYWRKDRRFLRFPQDEYEIEVVVHTHDEDESVEERALQSLMQLMFLEQVAYLIVKFPDKQRRALLINLASHTDIGEEPAPLEKALGKMGIQLQDFRCDTPSDPAERSRHNTLVCLAYKRLRKMLPTSSGPSAA
ncbi:sigma-70 family RNA polymerase sigma factor [Ktedonosporobacter rubrisoli]|uniref:Sigma-70 family RNA polymerase sigma factor n=1 Tax=Ktedonosporobacter rubrisoli TaxID=2509675 RepID=A0A4P6K0G0_KTERU|nr:sigma-70 family RNA polymerase sigma factor [Ktedonosporobacter rubrisoli]QBD81262.1 sigma-70 family RNA polymerase sigma factor [Ktedonosporobacter rubrisoli]